MALNFLAVPTIAGYRPVIAAAAERLHGVAVSLHDQSVAVMLDLMDPAGSGWDPGMEG
jgi:hypothetical protein